MPRPPSPRAALALALLLAPAAWPQPNPEVPPGIDALNLGFHQSYEARIAAMLPALGDALPVILVLDDQLVLLARGRREVAGVQPPMFHLLKSIDHLPLGLFAHLQGRGEGPFSPAERRWALTRAAQVRAARQAWVALPAAQRPAAVDRAARDVLDRCEAFLESARSRGPVTAARLQRAVRGLAPSTLRLARQAAALKLRAMRAALDRWEAADPSLADEARVVLATAHQARAQEISLQFFQARYGEEVAPGALAERRVLVFECGPDEDAMLDLLARHLLDRAVGRAFFDDPARLQRDLLSDGAREELASW